MKLVKLAASLVVALFCIQGQVRAQEEVIEPDEVECLTRWEETKAAIDDLYARGLGQYNLRVAKKCEKLWTTPEQKAAYAQISQFEKNWKKNIERNEAQRVLDEKQKNEAESAKKAAADAKRSAENAKWAVESRRIKIGMNRNEVSYRWGYPERTAKTTTEDGVHEIWFYKGGALYLSFRDGKLTAIHEAN